MTQSEKIVIRILLMICRWLAPSDWQEEIKALSSHINVWVRETPKEDA